MPDSAMRFLIQREIVAEVTDLWGFHTAMNNNFDPSSPQNEVSLSYPNILSRLSLDKHSHLHWILHTIPLSGGLSVSSSINQEFWKTSCSVICIKLMSRRCRSDSLSAFIIAIRVANFHDNFWICNCEEEGISLMWPKTISMSHTKLYLGIGGQELKNSLHKSNNCGVFPYRRSLNMTRYRIEERYELIVLYCLPSL